MLLVDFHSRDLRKSDQLSRLQAERLFGPLDVIRVLQKEKISFVLVGAYGLAGWMKKPRATEDVAVVVALRQVKKAVRELAKAFPELDAEDCEFVVRMRNRQTDKIAIDVMKPIQPPYVDIFRHTHKVVVGRLGYRVPSLEMALACKFAPLVSVARANEKKYQDAHDFVVMAKNNLEVDLESLHEIGESIFPGGGKEIVEKVHQARAGQKLVF